MDRPQANLIVVGDGSNPTPGLRGLRGALLMFPSDIKAQRGFAASAQFAGSSSQLMAFGDDGRYARFVEPTWQVEAMMTADSFQLAAYGLGRMRGQKETGAVSREPQIVMRKP